jgi:hypothetical protein
MRRTTIHAAFMLAVFALLLSGCATGGTDGHYGMPAPGGVRGVLTGDDGDPMPGAAVYFYTGNDRNFRGPADFMAEPAAEDGSYVTELPPGRYWAVARKRASGSVSGNLEKGDYQSRDMPGPVDVVEGEYTRQDITLSLMTGNMLFSAFSGKGGVQGIRGIIKDRDGTPHHKAYAFAYKDRKMAGKPDYVSEWTREDGSYVIYVMEPGTYYVGARTGYMGVPRPDEPYGRYAGDEDHSVTVVADGFIDGVDVTLGRFSSER